MRLADDINLQAGRHKAAHNPFCYMFVVSAVDFTLFYTAHDSLDSALSYHFNQNVAVFGFVCFLPGGEEGSSTKISCGKQISVWGK